MSVHSLLRSNILCNTDLLLLGLSRRVSLLQCRIRPILVAILTHYHLLSSNINIDRIHPRLRVSLDIVSLLLTISMTLLVLLEEEEEEVVVDHLIMLHINNINKVDLECTLLPRMDILTNLLHITNRGILHPTTMDNPHLLNFNNHSSIIHHHRINNTFHKRYLNSVKITINITQPTALNLVRNTKKHHFRINFTILPMQYIQLSRL